MTRERIHRLSLWVPHAPPSLDRSLLLSQGLQQTRLLEKAVPVSPSSPSLHIPHPSRAELAGDCLRPETLTPFLGLSPCTPSVALPSSSQHLCCPVVAAERLTTSNTFSKKTPDLWDLLIAVATPPWTISKCQHDVSEPWEETYIMAPSHALSI